MSGALRQLALSWLACAHEDVQDSRAFAATPIGEALAAVAKTRRNCAWELMRALNGLEKENPLEGGYPSPPAADHESA